MFSDIKVGDKVMYHYGVRLGDFDRQPERFWCPNTVTHVTPKRFTTANGTYHKVSGKNIVKYEPYMPSLPSVKLLSEVEDETGLRQAYLKKIKLQRTVSELTGGSLTADQCERIILIATEKGVDNA